MEEMSLCQFTVPWLSSMPDIDRRNLLSIAIGEQRSQNFSLSCVYTYSKVEIDA